MTLRAILAVCLTACGCAALERGPRAPEVAATAVEAEALDRSLFAHRGSSGMDEAEIARVLDAPLALKLPTRIGVVALVRGFTPGAPRTADEGLAAARVLAEALERSSAATLASEVAAELPTGGGFEGLRELAVRYRAGLLALYSERIEDRSHASGWSALYVTLLGGLVTPSVALEGDGRVEVSLLEVRTGTILFTVHEPVHFHGLHLPFGAGAAYFELRRRAAEEAARALAVRVVEKLERLARIAGPAVAGAEAVARP